MTSHPRPVSVGGLAALALGLACNALAAAPASHAADDPLAAQVQLRLGDTTLARVLAAISEQTRAPVRCEPWLAERRPVVQMDGITANRALADLCELNDWRLHTDKGETVVCRPTSLPPRNLPETSGALRAALPLDVRTFLGAAVSAVAEEPGRPAALVLSGPMTWHVAAERLRKASDHRQEMLAASIAPVKPGDGAPKHAYASLTETQQRQLLTLIVGQALCGLASDPDAYGRNILDGRFKPFQLDETVAYLQFKGGSFDVRGAYPGPRGRETAFGEQILAPEQLPDPLGLRRR